MENQLTKTETKQNMVESFNVKSELPNLHENGMELPIDLTSEYWTPNEIGEYKLCFFQEIKASTYVDKKTGESIDLDCAHFISQDSDGTTKNIRNGSVILVSTLDEYVKDGTLTEGTPLKITFMGKRKTSNGNNVDTWSVKPIIVK